MNPIFKLFKDLLGVQRPIFSATSNRTHQDETMKIPLSPVWRATSNRTHEDNSMNGNVDVRRIRDELGMDQKEFAERFGVSVEDVQSWEKGKEQPRGPSRVLLALADVGILPPSTSDRVHLNETARTRRAGILKATSNKTHQDETMQDDVDVPKLLGKLPMSREVLARRFGFSVEDVRSWEAGEKKPEGPARALLVLIAQEPAKVLRALSLLEPPSTKTA